MPSIELPGGSMRRYKESKRFFGVKISAQIGTTRLGTVSFLAATNRLEDRLPTISCQYDEAASEDVRMVIEQAVLAVLQSGQLLEIAIECLGCQHASTVMLITGIRFAEVYTTPKITTLAYRFFELLRKQMELSQR